MYVYLTEVQWGNSGAFVGVSAEDIMKIMNSFPSSFLYQTKKLIKGFYLNIIGWVCPYFFLSFFLSLFIYLFIYLFLLFIHSFNHSVSVSEPRPCVVVPRYVLLNLMFIGPCIILIVE